MQIEIYMPCEPDIVCDGITHIIIALVILIIILFVCVLVKEYKTVYKNKPITKLNRKNDNNRDKDIFK